MTPSPVSISPLAVSQAFNIAGCNVIWIDFFKYKLLFYRKQNVCFENFLIVTRKHELLFNKNGIVLEVSFNLKIDTLKSGFNSLIGF